MEVKMFSKNLLLAPVLSLLFWQSALAQDVGPKESTAPLTPGVNETIVPENKESVAAAVEPVIEKKESEENEHYFGLSASVGLPHPLNVGREYLHSSKLCSVGVSTGSFSHTQEGAKLGIGSSDVALRWHPFRGSFYLGALLGEQKITGEKTEVISSQSITAEVEVKSSYSTPVLGWMWGSGNGGFYASMEFGYQTPSGVKSKLVTNADSIVRATPEYAELEKDVKDAANDIGNMSLPHVVLLKLGWLF